MVEAEQVFVLPEARSQIAQSIKLLLLIQCVIGCVVAGVLLFWSTVAAYSSLAGAAIAVLPNVYFALRVFDLSKGRSAASTLRGFYVGASGKFIVTIAMFCATFILLSPINAPALLGTFAVAQLANWLSLLINSKK